MERIRTRHGVGRQARRAWLVACTTALALVAAGCASTISGVAQTVPGAAPVTSSTAQTTGSTESTGSTRTTDTTGSTETTESTGSTESTDTTESTEQTDTTSGGGGTGDYPTTPRDIPATPASEESAALLESRRLASVVVVPTFVDADFTQVGSISTLPLKGPSALVVVLNDPVPEVARRGGMISGFAASRSTTDSDSGMVTMVLQYGTAAQATKAVTDLTAASADKESDTGKLTVPGYDKAGGWTGKSSSGGTYSHAFAAAGEFVLYSWVDSPADAYDQPALIAKAFDAMTASADAFTPASGDALMKLPTDTDGLLAHTLANTGDNATVHDGLYDSSGVLVWDTDPIGTKELFADAGVDIVGLGRTNVYRAADDEGAAMVRDAFVEFTLGTDGGWTEFSPDASGEPKCAQQALNSVYYCMATSGRYAIELSASSESDLIAALNAQYQLLQSI
ncbi:hypothetical protein GIS00_10490 [Nakamurella sp. YIM 132087]|uniref:Uncharacterized protein n=1 Tax=Nakamurella alba TaxID=2665158 RepID=A0A7K1FJQ9_9ACTN|nr:hypothetical protein [Nakamurella alba]MTD14377.1 hypothetical protein [Nakamurella alba]